MVGGSTVREEFYDGVENIFFFFFPLFCEWNSGIVFKSMFSVGFYFLSKEVREKGRFKRWKSFEKVLASIFFL